MVSMSSKRGDPLRTSTTALGRVFGDFSSAANFPPKHGSDWRRCQASDMLVGGLLGLQKDVGAKFRCDE